MDFQTAVTLGYYFDRCIDLVFYNSANQEICRLNTPKRGLKPNITIKGSFIAGGYSVDSYISIQNLAFDIEVSNVSYILARMYYSGLSEGAVVSKSNNALKNGTYFLFQVLFADQDKEPPNRCVKFQCIVASRSMECFTTPLEVSGGNADYITDSEYNNSNLEVIETKGGTKTTLKNLIINIAKIYNKGITANYGTTVKNSNAGNKLVISSVSIPSDLENKEIVLIPGQYTIGTFIRQLNSYTEYVSGTEFAYSPFKISIINGMIKVTKPVPSNWQDIAVSQGYSGKEDIFYQENYQSEYNVYIYNDGNLKTADTTSSVVPLNFVRYATRTANNITAEIMFDGRIYPNCICAILGSSIMGKKLGSKAETRILSYVNEKVEFEVIGAIEYIFSTVENSYMKLTGVVTDEYKIDEAEYSAFVSGA